MKEYPIFVPYEGEHLAAVLAVPDRRARGLVALMCGVGAPRSHRFQMWTRTARHLADLGMASVRLDYLGIGDSTGSVRKWGPELEPQLLDQAMNAVRVAMEATGVDKVAFVGNCLGGRFSLLMASKMSETAGAVCILPMVATQGRVKSRLSKAKRSRLARFVRNNPLLRRLVLAPLRELGGKVPASTADHLLRALSRGRIIFVFGQGDHALTKNVRDQIDGVLAKATPEYRDRFDLHVLPEGPLAGFESIDIQDAVIAGVPAWLDEVFPPAAEATGKRAGVDGVRMS